MFFYINSTMLVKNKVSKSLLIVIALVFVSYFVKDWIDFAQCGVVDKCLQDAHTYQNYTKFLSSFLLTVLAFYVSRFACCPRDGKWLRIAFVFSMFADGCFRLLGMFAPDFPISPSILGILGFMFFQSSLIYRHTRTSDTETHFPKILFVPIAILIVLGAVYFAGFAPQMLFVIGSYAAFLICSVIVAFKAGSVGYFSPHKAKLMKIGMIMFFICDALVGLALAGGNDHTFMGTVSAVADGLIWIAYVPALLLLIKSGCED